MLHLTSRFKVKWLKYQHPGAQLWTKEFVLIYRTLLRIDKCRLLVFGMGNDSPIWSRLNKNGETCFLENNRDWFDKIRPLIPHDQAYQIEHRCQLTRWREYLKDETDLQLDLPEAVTAKPWDVIFVDGPCGDLVWSQKNLGGEPPGRMASLFWASRLVKDGGHIFVHDLEREVEKAYADRYLNSERLVRVISGRADLGHFVMDRSKK